MARARTKRWNADGVVASACTHVFCCVPHELIGQDKGAFGPVRGEQLGALGVAMETGHAQRSPAHMIREVHRCARAEQQLSALDVASTTGEEQRGCPSTTGLIHVHARLEQQRGRSSVAEKSSTGERHPAVDAAHREEAAVLVLEPLVDGLVPRDGVEQRIELLLVG